MEEKNELQAAPSELLEKKDSSTSLSLVQAILINAIIVAAAIIIAAMILSHDSGGATKAGVAQNANPSDAAQQAATTPDITKVKTAGEPFIGNPNAPVTIAYWSDYQCPFCKKFETTTFQDVLKNYVQTGKVKVVFKDFAFLGDDSIGAALYGRAVWDLYPDQFFAWRTAMFNAQDGENTGFGDEASVKKLTASIAGIDADKVTAAVVQNKDAYMKAIDADQTEGTTFGLKGTPGFITGTQLIPGAVSYAVISSALDAQLK